MRIQNSLKALVYKRVYGELQLLCGNTEGSMRTEKADLKILRIKPGLETSHHYHLQRESIFHVISGQVLLKSVYAALERELLVGDTVIVEPSEDHVFKNIGDTEAIIFEIESPPHSSDDKIPYGSIRRGTIIPSRPHGRFWINDSSTKLKICGIKNLDSAIECHRLGVDAIGIHAVGAKGIQRALNESDWLLQVPQEMSVFLLTDSSELGTLHELIAHTGCDTIQVQGLLSTPELEQIAQFIRICKRKIVRTISARKGTSKEELFIQIAATRNVVDAFLIDAGSYGGTGQEHDWELTEALRSEINLPLIIAGGLGASNCHEAIERLHPYGLDVETSSEKQFPSPGEKRITAKDFASIGSLLQIIHSTKIE